MNLLLRFDYLQLDIGLFYRHTDPMINSIKVRLEDEKLLKDNQLDTGNYTQTSLL